MLTMLCGFSGYITMAFPHTVDLVLTEIVSNIIDLLLYGLDLLVVAMASLVHPKRFQPEGALNLVRNLLGWSAPAFAGRICAGATPLGDLAAGKFVLFVSYLSCGLALPISPFFLLQLEEFGLQL